MMRPMMRPSLVFACLLAGCQAMTPFEPASDQPTTQPVAEAVPAAATQPATEPPERPISSLVEGELGAGGGFVIGVEPAQSRDAAILASRQAERAPCTAESADQARTADLNSDGCVTLDEVVAMRKVNLAPRDILDRLARTGHFFELTAFQKDYLRTRGVTDDVINAIENLNFAAMRSASAAR